jgi:hypothetical protein
MESAMSQHKKGSYPHVFKRGQVVFWGNGQNEYMKIIYLNPLHCDGGAPNYILLNLRIGTHSNVSQEEIRPLTFEEMGIFVAGGDYV